MSDEARKWLEWYEEYCDGNSMAPTHLRRLLEQNERLEAELGDARGISAGWEGLLLQANQEVTGWMALAKRLEADNAAPKEKLEIGENNWIEQNEHLAEVQLENEALRRQVEELQKEVEELRVEGARSDDLVWDQTNRGA